MWGSFFIGFGIGIAVSVIVGLYVAAFYFSGMFDRF